MTKPVGLVSILMVIGFCLHIQLQVNNLNSIISDVIVNPSERVGSIGTELFSPSEFSPDFIESGDGGGVGDSERFMSTPSLFGRSEADVSLLAETQSDYYNPDDPTSRSQIDQVKIAIGEAMSPDDLSAYSSADVEPKNFGQFRDPDLP